MAAPKIYKKYPNRRLYDVQQKTYVNLDDVKQAVLNFNLIQVVDANTKEDLTNSVLLQIINKQQSEDQTQAITAQTLIGLIMLYESPLAGMMNFYLENFLRYLHHQSPTNPDGTQPKATDPSHWMNNPLTGMAAWNQQPWSALNPWQNLFSNESPTAAKTDPDKDNNPPS